MDPVKLKAEKEERERQEKIAREAAAAALLAQLLYEENRKRLIHLKESGFILKHYDDLFSQSIANEAERSEWNKYVLCKNIPDISVLSHLNSYLVEWTLILEKNMNLKTIFTYTPQILELLDEIQTFLDNPLTTVSIDSLNEMGTIYYEIKEKQQRYLDGSTYNILMNLSGLYDPEVGIIDDSVEMKEIKHSLWCNFYSCPEYFEHSFGNLDFHFKIPEVLVMTKGAYRLVKLEYDHYSDLSISYYPPNSQKFLKKAIQNWISNESLTTLRRSSINPLENDYQSIETSEVKEAVELTSKVKNLFKTKVLEVLDTIKYKAEVEAIKIKDSSPPPPPPSSKDEKSSQQNKKDSNNQGEIEKNKSISPERQNPVLEVLAAKMKGKKVKGGEGKQERTKTEAELAKERERKEKAEFIPLPSHPNELNLRNYSILGGIFDFRLFSIPKQPTEEVDDKYWTLQNIETEEKLKEICFEADYRPPPLYDLQEVKKTPEEMEREAKRQEEELQKLVLVEIKAPRTSLWFEPPTIVRWKKNERFWSTEGFYDIRFNEDSLQLSFRATSFGIIALGHNRWSNLPYQSWELRPNGPNGAILSLMAAMAVLEFTIENDLISVSSLQNVSNSDLIEREILGKPMKPLQLIKTLRKCGLDVFPEFDSYAYVDGILIKETETEDHLYQCMAIAATAFNFHWSRWNLLAGRNKMVYQIRERHGTSTPGNYRMVLNTPKRAGLIDCTEVSPNYSEEPIGEYEVS